MYGIYTMRNSYVVFLLSCVCTACKLPTIGICNVVSWYNVVRSKKFYSRIIILPACYSFVFFFQSNNTGIIFPFFWSQFYLNFEAVIFEANQSQIVFGEAYYKS